MNVAPSQPQNGRRSRVHLRAAGAHFPGASSPQPCPSHTLESQSAAVAQVAPTARAVGAPSGGE